MLHNYSVAQYSSQPVSKKIRTPQGVFCFRQHQHLLISIITTLVSNHCICCACRIALPYKLITMKKVLLVCDGSHFSEAAFKMAAHLQTQQPVLLTGVFLGAEIYKY